MKNKRAFFFNNLDYLCHLDAFKTELYNEVRYHTGYNKISSDHAKMYNTYFENTVPTYLLCSQMFVLDGNQTHNTEG